MHNATALPEDLEAHLHDDFTDEEVKRWSEPSAPLVSILMPVYNAEKYLAAAIESCLAQTYKRWELVVWDDCSTDGSVAIVKSYARKDCRIKLHYGTERPPVQTAVYAFNHLLKLAKGSIIAWQHADDLQKPDRIYHQVKALVDNPDADVVSCSVKLLDSGGEPFLCPNGERATTLIARPHAAPTPSIVAWSRIYEEDSVGLFDTSYPTLFDIAWCIQAHNLKVVWGIIFPQLYTYRLHCKQTIATEEWKSQRNAERLRLGFDPI